MICIAGGTGLLGRRLVHLLSAHEDVQVLTREPARGAALPARLVQGDVRDTDAVAAAMRGCSTVISAVHGFLGGRGAGPEAIDRDGNANLIRTAARQGVERFVLVSVMDAAADHPMVLHRMKFAAELRLRDSPLAWTIVRPSAFVQTWVDIVGGKLAAGGPALVFGRGMNPVNFVSADDVAAVIAVSLTDPSLTGTTVDIGGPDNVTLTEIAARLAAHHGVPGRVTHIPEPVLRLLSALARPLAPRLARQAAGGLAMGAMDMTFDNASLGQRFPQIDWHHLTDIIGGIAVPTARQKSR